MLKLKRILAALLPPICAVLGAMQAASALEPRTFVATYDIEARGFKIGETQWRVDRVADGFIYETRTKAVGIAAFFSDKKVVQRSRWAPFEGRLKPAHYRYDRSDRPDKNVIIDFDWNTGIAHNTRGGKTSRLKVPADTVDKLSYVLQLMEDVQEGRRVIQYNIADGKNRVKVYTLRVAGEERLDTALGTLDTIKVIRDRQDDERETVTWMAPSLGFVPVRIEHQERDGEEVTIRLRSLSYAPAPAAEKTGADRKTLNATHTR